MRDILCCPQTSRGGPSPNLSSSPSPWCDVWHYLEISWLGSHVCKRKSSPTRSLEPLELLKILCPLAGSGHRAEGAILAHLCSAGRSQEIFWRSLAAGGRLSRVWGRVMPVLGVSGTLERHRCHCQCGLYHCNMNMVPDHKYGWGRVSDSRLLTHTEPHRPIGARSLSPRCLQMPPSHHAGHPLPA